MAARHQQSCVTFIFVSFVTGVVGGTVRALLIGAPVFWLNENLTLLICFLSVATVWLTPAQLWNGRTLDWLDGVGLAAYAVYGAAKALANGVAPVPSFGLVVFSACSGGILWYILA